MKDKKKGVYYVLARTLHRFDIFGLPITLNFDNNSEFKTSVGGFCSIILYILMIYVSITLSIRVFGRKDVEISQSVSNVETIFNNQSVNPFENNKFKIGKLLLMNINLTN